MKYLDGILVVEGSNDASFISSFLSTEIVVLNGCELANLDYLIEASKTTTIFLLTDPDEEGLRIREKLNQKLDVINIDLINLSSLEGLSKGNSILCFDILNAKNKNEIYLMFADEKINCLNDEFLLDVSNLQTDEITICLKVFSNRDNSYLGEKEFDLKFEDDMEVLDFEITNIYDPWCEANCPVEVSKMPAGVIRKGYAFDFSITSRGLNKMGDYIYILPKYYYLSKEGIKPCEIIRYNKGLIHPYEMKILNGGKQIGTLDYLYLNSDDRWMNNNEEIYNGKFYLPSDCRIRTGDEVFNDGLVLVNFEIIAVSETGNAYNYNTNKWLHLNSSPYNSSGDTAIFDIKLGGFSDYKNYLKY